MLLKFTVTRYVNEHCLLILHKVRLSYNSGLSFKQEFRNTTVELLSVVFGNRAFANSFKELEGLYH